MAAFKLIDHFFPDFVHQRIYAVITHKYFPYYYRNYVTYENNNKEKEDIRELAFVHGLYSDKKTVTLLCFNCPSKIATRLAIDSIFSPLSSSV